MAKAGRERKKRMKMRRFTEHMEAIQAQRRVFTPAPLATAIASAIKTPNRRYTS